MDTELVRNQIQMAYGDRFEAALLDEMAATALLVQFSPGDVLIDIHQYIRRMPLLLSGAIKIMREDPDEGELLLYFLERGDTCAMTLACCMGEAQSEVRAIAETSGALAMIPVSKMENWLGRYKSWRHFVFESYNKRLTEMLAAVDSLAFLKMDQRLLAYLREKAKVNGSQVLTITHQDIAYELNTSRVVVSRLLKAMENDNQIRLHRNSIEILFALN